MAQGKRNNFSSRFWRGFWRDPRVRLATARMFFRGTPHGQHLGFKVRKVEPRAVEAEMPYRDDLVGNPWTGTLHAGPVITLLDQTCGTCASLSMNPPWIVATLDLRVDYLRPAEPGRTLRARAETYRVTREIVFLRGEVHDGTSDTAVATCMATFMRTRPLIKNPVKGLRKLWSVSRQSNRPAQKPQDRDAA